MLNTIPQIIRLIILGTLLKKLLAINKNSYGRFLTSLSLSLASLLISNINFILMKDLNR